MSFGDDQHGGNVWRRNVSGTSSALKSDTPADESRPDSEVQHSPEVTDAYLSPYSAQNFAWILAAIGVVYFTGLIDTVLNDVSIYRSWLSVGFLLIAINLAIATFLVGYLTMYRKMAADDWDRHYPLAIPVATACAFFGGVCLMIALWPVWSFLTPLILFVILMGFVVSISMLPAFD